MKNKNQLAEFITKRIGGNHKNNLKLIREFEEMTEELKGDEERDKLEIMKELGKSFDDFRNNQTELYDLYELAYFCYMAGMNYALKGDEKC